MACYVWRSGNTISMCVINSLVSCVWKLAMCSYVPILSFSISVVNLLTILYVPTSYVPTPKLELHDIPTGSQPDLPNTTIVIFPAFHDKYSAGIDTLLHYR